MNNTATALRGATDRPETQVESEVSNLQNAHKELIERCHALSQRLSSVLRNDPQPIEKDNGMSAPRVMLVPLAEQLREIGDMTGAAIRQLNDIASSLELPYPMAR